MFSAKQTLGMLPLLGLVRRRVPAAAVWNEELLLLSSQMLAHFPPSCSSFFPRHNFKNAEADGGTRKNGSADGRISSDADAHPVGPLHSGGDSSRAPYATFAPSHGLQC